MASWAVSDEAVGPQGSRRPDGQRPERERNLLEVERLAEEAARSGAGLLVLPENFAFMGLAERDILAIGEADGAGPLQDFLAQLARRLGIWLVGGTVPIRVPAADKVRAACLVYDGRGRCVARYDKIHLFDVHLVETDEHYRESETIEPGDRVCVVDSPFGRLGLAVCYDLRFPELFRAMQDQGVALIALPAAFTATASARKNAVLGHVSIEDTRSLLFRFLFRIDLDQTVPPVAERLDLEYAPAELKGACHGGAVEHKRKLPQRLVVSAARG